MPDNSEGQKKIQRRTRLSTADLVQTTKSKVSEALGKKVYLVSGVTQQEKGGWSAEVEVIEEEHMISNFDVIGTYSTLFDEEGNLINWSRKQLRKRE
jgi:hypothetical protein